MVGIILFKLERLGGFGFRHDSHYLLERLTEGKNGNKGPIDGNNYNDEDQKKNSNTMKTIGT